MIEEGAVLRKKSTEDLASWSLWEQIKPAFVLVILGSISHLLVGYSVEVWLVGFFLVGPDALSSSGLPSLLMPPW